MLKKMAKEQVNKIQYSFNVGSENGEEPKYVFKKYSNKYNS